MHILLITDIPFDTGSWIGRYAPMAKYLGRKSHKISILITNPNPRKDGYALENTENVFIYETGIPYWMKIEGGRRHHYSTLELCRIGFKNIINSIRLLMRLNPDLVIVCKPLPIAGIVGLFSKFFKKKSMILDCDDAEVAINSVRSNFQRSVIHGFENLLPRFCDLVFVNTKYTLQRIRMIGVPERKIAFISNGVDVERFAHITHCDLPEGDLRGNKIILYSGDLNFASGHHIDILLNAFKIFLCTYPASRLLIIGDGADESNLKQLASKLGIESKIIWKGRVSPEEVPSYVSVSDIVVDPVRNVLSNLARCPLKIIEAMYLGKPVVTSDVGDRKNLLGDFGFFAQENDPHSMAKKLLEAINDKEFKKNRDLMIKRSLDYSWDKLVDRVEVLLKKELTK